MKLLNHRMLGLVTRLALGGVLVYACYHKIDQPPDFAKIIYNYRLLPEGLVNLAAIYLPWLELVLGLSLIVGLGRQAAALITALMFAGFIAALSYNLARECPTICGCFDTYASGKDLTNAEKFAKMRREIALDAGLLLLAVHVLVTSWRGSKSKTAT